LRSFKAILHLFVLAGLIHHSAFSQDLEPRRWTTLPLGIDIIGAGYAYTGGEILFDPVLQAEDVNISANSVVLQYVKPLKVGNMLGRLDVYVPFSIVKWEGLLQGIPASVERNGFNDARVRFSLNFSGPGPMNPKELFQFYKENRVYTTFGASVTVGIPFGQYFEEKLLNLGENRFMIRPQIGMLHNWGPWSFELSSSLFIYTNNNDFFNGQQRKQRPLIAVQSHLIRRFGSNIWATFSAGYGQGGRSVVDDISNKDQRANFLSSLALGMPVTQKHSIKLAYINLRTFRDIGANTHTLIAAWSLVL